MSDAIERIKANLPQVKLIAEQASGPDEVLATVLADLAEVVLESHTSEIPKASEPKQ